MSLSDSLDCTKAEFKCEETGSCISIIKKCDGYPDCSDDKSDVSDEKNCPTRSVCAPFDNCAKDKDSKCLKCGEEPGPIPKPIMQCGSEAIQDKCKNDDDCCTGYCYTAECQQRGNFKIISVICAS